MKIWFWDIPLLILFGAIIARIYARWLVVKHPDFFFHAMALTIVVFWLNALVSALGGWPWFGVRHVYIIPKGIGLFTVLSYPLWLTFGAERTFALSGRRPTQGGFLWPFSVRDRTKPFRPPWQV